MQDKHIKIKRIICIIKIYLGFLYIFHSYIERENKYFYYNKQSNTSQWEHPLDEYYRQIVEKTRTEDPSTGKWK